MIKNINNAITLSSLDTKSSFIHVAYGNQVQQILQKFFKNYNEVFVLELDKENGIELRPEANKQGGEIFPHLYGTQKIPLSLIKKKLIFKKIDKNNWKQK